MIYLDLLLGFLKVGCFAFGGAYASIPLIREVVLQYQWLTDEQLTYIIAVSESTPGPIMINLATYVGSTQAGFLGSLIATIAVVTPSFLLILLIMFVLKAFMKNAYVKSVFQGLKPCITGIILATGAYMMLSNCVTSSLVNITTTSIHMDSVLITILLGCIILFSRIVLKRKIQPILLIVISAGLGIIVGYL